jgi:hypothetical protein
MHQGSIKDLAIILHVLYKGDVGYCFNYFIFMF